MKRLNLSLRPYNLFLPAAILLVVVSIFILGQKADIHLHDTYFVFSISLLYWVCALFFMILWVLYSVLRRLTLKPYMTWLHITATLLFFLILVTANFWYPLISYTLQSDAALPFSEIMKQQQHEVYIYASVALLFIIGQLCFILNIIYGVGLYVRNRYIDRNKRS